MITATQYFYNPTAKVSKPHVQAETDAADDLLKKVNAFLTSLNWAFPIDPDTGCSISGAKGGSGDGGFRLPDSKTGASHSNHRLAHAVDVYDPANELDDLITDALLECFGLYREHPDATNGWCHLQDLPPKSKLRTYHP